MRRLVAVFMLLIILLPVTSVLGQSNYVQYTVVRGDNLFRISLRFGTTIASIVAANPSITNPNLIFAGQVLNIPTGGTPPTQPPPTEPPPPGQEQTYTVVRGDWLSTIAIRFGTTVSALVQRNGIVNPNLIYPGQVLVIPAGGTTPPTQPPPTEPPPSNTGNFALGGQVFGFQYPTLMLDTGMTWVKRQVVWQSGQPATIAQGMIDEAHTRGFKILLSVVGSPEELRQNPSGYYQQFASFLGGVAALGPDGIEVWNEQNIDREWPNGLISPQSYTTMLSQAYNAIKGVNSNILVISGAPAPTGYFGGACTSAGCDDAPYLQGMRNAGAANYMDCVGIHYNEGILSPNARSGDPRGNPNHYTRYYPTMVETYRAIFPTRQLCFTELGYLSPEGYGELPAGFSWAANVSAQDQATWLAQAVSLSKANSAIRLLIIWNVDSTSYGADPQAGYAIIRPDNQCLACNTIAAVLQ